MPLLLQCLEPQGRPPVVALPLEAGGSFAVYALADALEGDRGLRATVLRGAGQFPPDGAVLILEGSASVGNAATLPPLRVSRVGPDVLVAPVTELGVRERDVYLPTGASWLDAWTGEPVQTNGWVSAAAPIERIPVYLRAGGSLRSLSTGDSD